MSELVEQLSASDAPSRAAAAWALAGAGRVDMNVVEALEAAADHDHSALVREGAVWALGHLEAEGWCASGRYDLAPKVVLRTYPVFPTSAFAHGVQGVVLLDVLIDEAGRVSHLEVRESLPELDAAALDCARKWQFTPAMRNGLPVPAIAHMPISFRIY